MKTRDEILKVLALRRGELREKFGVKSMALFGSAARGEASGDSDVDVLVEISAPITLFDLAALEEYLTKALEVPRVDVVLRDSIFPPLRESILSSAIDVD